MEPATVRVVSVDEVGPETIALEVATPPDFEARPGQFVKLSVTLEDEHRSRFYTISSPDVTDTFELTVGVDPDGAVGPWLATAEGAEVTIEGPYGAAAYEGEERLLVLAGGPGIGPAVGIGERAVEDGHDVAIVYRTEGPAHTDRLERIEAAGGTVEMTDGPIDALVDALVDDRQVFIYGFQAFVDEAVAALLDVGADPSAAKIENFG